MQCNKINKIFAIHKMASIDWRASSLLNIIFTGRFVTYHLVSSIYVLYNVAW